MALLILPSILKYALHLAAIFFLLSFSCTGHSFSIFFFSLRLIMVLALTPLFCCIYFAPLTFSYRHMALNAIYMPASPKNYITNPGISHKLHTYAFNMSKTILVTLHYKLVSMDNHHGRSFSIPVVQVAYLW